MLAWQHRIVPQPNLCTAGRRLLREGELVLEHHSRGALPVVLLLFSDVAMVLIPQFAINSDRFSIGFTLTVVGAHAAACKCRGARDRFYVWQCAPDAHGR